jgi:ribosome maturation factor RimP
MSSKRNEIEAIIEDVVENIIFEVFDNNFTTISEVEFALEVLKDRIQNLDVDDFEHFIN